MQFIISETDEVLVPQAGLAVVGALLQGTTIKRRTSAIKLEDCPRPGHGQPNRLASRGVVQNRRRRPRPRPLEKGGGARGGENSIENARERA